MTAIAPEHDLTDRAAADAGFETLNEPAHTPAAKPPAKKVAATPTPPAAGPNKALVRKIVGLTLDIESAAATRREMLTTLLGLRRNADTTALVVGIYTASTATTAPIMSLLSVAEQSDDMEAVVAAVELAEDRDLAKAVWALLTSLGAVTSSLPPVAAKAGGAIAKAARSLGEKNTAELGALRDLLR